MTAVALLASCNDFLEENPETKLSSENVYNDKNTANGVLAGAYAQLAGYNGYSYSYMHLLSTTSGLGVTIKANEVDMGIMELRPTNTRVSTIYQTMYQVIKATNDIIQGMENSGIEDADFKAHLEGEARFVRAVQYFNLVRMYGPVPLVVELPTDYADAQNPRASVEDVYTQIVQDLTLAFDLMAAPGEEVNGHPHKYAAKALLAKVYLTQAGDDETSPHWQSCYDAALDVYTNGGYNLVKPYNALFGSHNNNNAESIFEVQQAVAQGGSRLSEMTVLLGYTGMPHAVGSKSWAKCRPNKYMFDLFEEEDPRRDVTFIHSSYVNFKDKNKTYMVYPTIKGTDEAKGMKYKVGDSEYAAWKKYVDPDLVTYSNCNFVYLRFTDIVLTLAEAANELDKQTEAVGYLDQILDRARDINGNNSFEENEVMPLAVPEDIAKSDLRDRIMHERLLELTGECDEWFTLRRRGTRYLMKVIQGNNAIVNALSKLPKFVYAIDASEEHVRKNLLLPFPQDEINRNEKIAQEEQNYGY